MLILSDLFWSITPESDTTLCADPVWSFLIHYTGNQHHALCWCCLIFSDPLRSKLTPRCVLILSDLFWSTTQETNTTMYADPVWSCLIQYTGNQHHNVCWSRLIFSDPVHRKPTPQCMLIPSDLVWSTTQETNITMYADPVW